MADGHIILQDLRKSFGSKHVLNGINLSVPKGHSLVVIGGSGTGKSVMLKCVLGILRADSGSIQIGGEEVVGLKGAARDEYLCAASACCSRAGALFDSLPVWENVAFGLIQGRNMPRAKAKDIAIEKLSQVGLERRSGQALPGGTFRRHAKARRPRPRHRRRS